MEMLSSDEADCSAHRVSVVVCLCLCLCLCVCVCVCLCMRLCLCVCLSKSVCMYVQMHVHVCVCLLTSSEACVRLDGLERTSQCQRCARSLRKHDIQRQVPCGSSLSQR
jgi:hypothetical protein